MADFPGEGLINSIIEVGKGRITQISAVDDTTIWSVDSVGRNCKTSDGGLEWN
jgi:hypothetical protein